MLDMSSSMPIFTTPSETFSWASAANGDASNNAALVAITPDLFIVTSQNSALRRLYKSIVLILPFFPQYRLGHLAQAQLLHFGAVWALDNRERFYYHNPLRDLEPRQLLQATCAQARLVHLRPGRRLNESYRHRVGHPSRSRHNLYSCHARLCLNDSLDLLGADLRSHRDVWRRQSALHRRVGASQAAEITGAEDAISVGRAFGCRRIFQILDEARRRVDPKLAGRAGWQRVPGLRIAYRKPCLTAYRHAASEQAVLALRDREQRLHF